MKIFFCIVCSKRKKPFTGTRQEVGKHLQEDHFMKSSKKLKMAVDGYKSPISANVGSYEI